ncbi:MAG: hypothetical protein JXA33_24530 [Anaerolineae bacterium]|nr:hypothetical protein [Anaerolineae bacterium]
MTKTHHSPAPSSPVSTQNIPEGVQSASAFSSKPISVVRSLGWFLGISGGYTLLLAVFSWVVAHPGEGAWGRHFLGWCCGGLGIGANFILVIFAEDHPTTGEKVLKKYPLLRWVGGGVGLFLLIGGCLFLSWLQDRIDVEAVARYFNPGYMVGGLGAVVATLQGIFALLTNVYVVSDERDSDAPRLAFYTEGNVRWIALWQLLVGSGIIAIICILFL